MHSTKRMHILTSMFLFILTAKAQADYEPRKLTVSEVKTNPQLKLENLLSPSTKTNKQQTPSEPAVPLNHLPKGTNLETGPKDAIRMPGTNWCGKGWRADSAKSMGGYAGADRCCRHHDLGCPISIEPGQTRYGLTNVRIHTVMHCSCDQRFRSCLKMARTQAADIVGNLFFNVADIPCFVFSKAKVCSARNWWGRCTSEQEKHSAVWRKPLPYLN
eukprot:GFUD01028046.1.p1 GENE.GFUD01028046.1~~GFUD01028046.1.p1  ORF type:complete len:216 (+),score=53.79 GFUD01028046.1:43-690(+)